MKSLTLQLKELKKKNKLGGRPISQHLRQLAQDRFQDVLDKRKEQTEHKRKVQAADAAEKRKLHEAKTREYLAKQAAAKTEQAWKKKRLDDEAAEKKVKSNLKSFHEQIAELVAKHLMSELKKFSPEDSNALKAHIKKPEVQARGKARKHLPLFTCMEKGETVAREVDPKVFRYIGSCVDTASMAKHNCDCSEAFEWLMCNGMRMYQHKEGVTGVGPVLHQLLNQTLPHYDHVCGHRWKSSVLLQEAGYNVDFAYLSGVWRYSHALGATYFPCGVRVWPPDF